MSYPAVSTSTAMNLKLPLCGTLWWRPDGRVEGAEFIIPRLSHFYQPMQSPFDDATPQASFVLLFKNLTSPTMFYLELILARICGSFLLSTGPFGRI
jgi:hypothetical protein